MDFKIDPNFQTPRVVCDKMAYMASLVELKYKRELSSLSVLEPTPGMCGLVDALKDILPWTVWFPGGDFWTSTLNNAMARYDVVVMNPPFNPVKEMERFVNRAMDVSDYIIALLPYNYLVNSERRVSELMDYGLVSITHLPRKTFPGCRVQVAIFELKKGYVGKTEFKRFTW